MQFSHVHPPGWNSHPKCDCQLPAGTHRCLSRGDEFTTRWWVMIVSFAHPKALHPPTLPEPCPPQKLPKSSRLRKSINYALGRTHEQVIRSVLTLGLSYQLSTESTEDTFFIALSSGKLIHLSIHWLTDSLYFNLYICRHPPA